MIKIVEATCVLSKSRGDQLLVTDHKPFSLVRVIALDGKQPANPFGQDVTSVPVVRLVFDPSGAAVFGALLPPPIESARAAAYEIRWQRPGAAAGVVFEVDQ